MWPPAYSAPAARSAPRNFVASTTRRSDAPSSRSSQSVETKASMSCSCYDRSGTCLPVPRPAILLWLFVFPGIVSLCPHLLFFKRGPFCLSQCCTARSEEHTSELQSLMRISYAVFCVKKTTQHHPV